MTSKNIKTIATINFKGGVGKTTVSWCLADTLASYSDSRVLVVDLDAQMSLTQAIALNEATGRLEDRFGKWYENSTKKNKTIFDAIDQYTNTDGKFDFPVGFDFIYQINKNLHFIPSVEDLYCLELDFFDRDSMKDFIRRILGKISNSSKLPSYDYAIFDCPPSFTLLSYSVLACCDLVLIPVNPDFFASRGVSLILNSLRMRIEPHPIPRIGVFMNKTKTWSNQPTKEAQFYIREVARVCENVAKQHGIRATFFDSWVRERVGIKRAITGGGVPSELVGDFEALWTECVSYMK